MTLTGQNGEQESIMLICPIYTANELDKFSHGCILQYVQRNLVTVDLSYRLVSDHPCLYCDDHR